MGSKSVCHVCALIWALVLMSGAFYATFILNRSGWWILAAVVMASFWSCKEDSKNA